MAPVRILGIPAISVAAPVLSRAEQAPDPRQRAAVIEGNLSLLYAPHGLCSTDPWVVLGRPADLAIRVSGDGSQLLAVLPGRPRPLPLLTVTEADAALHGLERRALAERWRQILQRYRNLRQASQRLIDLGCLAVLVLLVLADIPGGRQLTTKIGSGCELLQRLLIALERRGIPLARPQR